MPKVFTADSDRAIEKSAWSCRVDFLDTEGNYFTPTSCNWTLLTPDGEVVNSKEAVNIMADSSGTLIETDSDGSIYTRINLTGDDLAFSTGVQNAGRELRKILIEGTFTSTIFGANTPFRSQITFEIDGIVDKV